MEEKIIYIADREALGKEIESALKRVFNDQVTQKEQFTDDKVSLTAASKFVNMSIPTFSKRVKEGVFPKHGSERKIFFLKSELIEVLTAKTNGHE